MDKLKSILLFNFLFAIVLFFSFLITGQYFPPAEVQYLWFYSGIIMILFSMFFIEPYYTAPTNVIANCVAIILVLVSIKDNISNIETISYLWLGSLLYSSVMLVVSLAATILSDKDKSADNLQNKSAEILKDISVKFGSGKILYSGIFLIFLLFYHKIQDIKVLALIPWGCIPRRLRRKI